MELFMKYPNEVQQELLQGLLTKAHKTEMESNMNSLPLKITRIQE